MHPRPAEHLEHPHGVERAVGLEAQGHHGHHGEHEEDAQHPERDGRDEEEPDDPHDPALIAR